MKIFTALLSVSILTFCTIQGQGQIEDFDNDPYETVFSKNTRVRPTLGILFDVASVSDMQVTSSGMEIGTIINRKFDLGLYGLGSFNNPSFYDDDMEHVLSLFYVGPSMAYHFFPERAVHISAGLKYGWGLMSVKRGNWWPDWNITVINPSLNVEMNLSKWSRFNIGLGYKTFANVENPFIERSEFSNLNLSTSLRFGWFK